jgi:hypothetical protein
MNYAFLLVCLRMTCACIDGPKPTPRKAKGITARQHFYLMSGEWP